jgi:DNA-binding response OmpR family regulator
MSKTVLIIEDSATQRVKSENMLKKAGYMVLSAPDGDKGLEVAMARYNEIDMVICDNNLPTIQGWQICKKFKETKELKLIPIVIFTYLEEKEDLLQAISAGADDYILKNVDDEVIISKVYALIRISQLQKENMKLAQYKAIHAMVVSLNHEFNNASNILVGNLELLKGKISEPALAEYINSMFTSSMRISKLVAKLQEITEVQFDSYTDGVDYINLK